MTFQNGFWNCEKAYTKDCVIHTSMRISKLYVAVLINSGKKENAISIIYSGIKDGQGIIYSTIHCVNEKKYNNKKSE